MGQTLEKPITEKNFEHGAGRGMHYASMGMQGWRLTMEDAHTSVSAMDEPMAGVSVFGVFDGHAGSETSNLCAKFLHSHVAAYFKKHGAGLDFDALDLDGDAELKARLSAMLKQAFIEFDIKLKNTQDASTFGSTSRHIEDPANINANGNSEYDLSCGTTAVVVFVFANYYAFCNVGDSRAMLVSDGLVTFRTVDHKPSDNEEKERIINSGNNVIMDRVNGNLAVSRAFGDFSFKTNEDLDMAHQAVSPEPEVTFVRRKPNEDQFLFLACDGIWDVMTCEDVANFVLIKSRSSERDFDSNNSNNATDNLGYTLLSDLINCCLLKESRDNMTAMVVKFDQAFPKKDDDLIAQAIVYKSEVKNELAKILPTLKNKNDVSMYTAVKYMQRNTGAFTYSTVSQLEALSIADYVIDVLNALAPERDMSSDFIGASPMNEMPFPFRVINKLMPDKNLAFDNEFEDNMIILGGDGQQQDANSSPLKSNERDVEEIVGEVVSAAAAAGGAGSGSKISATISINKEGYIVLENAKKDNSGEVGDGKQQSNEGKGFDFAETSSEDEDLNNVLNTDVEKNEMLDKSEAEVKGSEDKCANN